MNHKMTTTTPFILLGFDADSFHNDKLMKMGDAANLLI